MPNDIQKNPSYIWYWMFSGGINHFEIINFCTRSVLEKNRFPKVTTVEISTTKSSRGSGKCSLLSLPQH
jgi:hypothetical protein